MKRINNITRKYSKTSWAEHSQTQDFLYDFLSIFPMTYEPWYLRAAKLFRVQFKLVSVVGDHPSIQAKIKLCFALLSFSLKI
jgi:hypothetical protein